MEYRAVQVQRLISDVKDICKQPAANCRSVDLRDGYESNFRFTEMGPTGPDTAPQRFGYFGPKITSAGWSPPSNFLCALLSNRSC